MAPPPADGPPRPDAPSLDALVQTASGLLAQLQAALADVHRDASAPAAAAPPTPDALAVARDSAALVRAHATKLALLLTHEPFTPSAVASVLRALVAAPVPALAAAAQACTAERYTAAVRRELAARCRRVVAELRALLHRVPTDVRAPAADSESGSARGDRGAIPTTGILWNACDDVIALAAMGVGGFFVHKAGQWRDTLKDVVDELKEWGDEEPDDDGDDGDDGDDDEHASSSDDSALSAQDMIDKLVASQPPIPRDDPDGIRPRLDASLKRLRLVTLLYEAAIKRRLKKLPSLPAAAAAAPDLPPRLDALAAALAALPDRAEDLAAALYDLQPAPVDAALDRCVADARAVAHLLAANWDGAPDDFSAWICRFQAEIEAAAQPSRQ